MQMVKDENLFYLHTSPYPSDSFEVHSQMRPFNIRKLNIPPCHFDNVKRLSLNLKAVLYEQVFYLPNVASLKELFDLS